MVILSLSLLTPYFYFIPKATLSSVIICAVIFMVEIGMIKPMWKSNSKYPFTRAVCVSYSYTSSSQTVTGEFRAKKQVNLSLCMP